jgi:osmotically-inducible protein OsmY
MEFFRLAALGAALLYLSDPARRAKLRNHVRELVSRSRPTKVVDDQTLKAKVESEVFRDIEAPKGDVNVNVEQGVVYLRGELGDQSLIQQLEQRVRTVHGVDRVENLLHTPGAEAPTAS